MSTDSTTPPRTLIAFATGWGSEFGGINVFNSEFLQHFAFATQGHVKVVCVVPAARIDMIKRAQVQGVTLVALPYIPAELKLDRSHARPAVEKLNELGMLKGEQELVWLGHDRITGAVALGAKSLAGGRVAMIHHMSYMHYEAYAESASSAYEKTEVQRALFTQAEMLFAIGPLLRDALEDMLPGREIITLVPGLDELPVWPAPKTFTGFMSGRLSSDASKIKQGHLGVAAFADAHKRAYSDPGLPDALKNQPRLILRGVDMENHPSLPGQPDASDWDRLAEAYADRVLNIHALSYTAEREALLNELSRATVALMPSWHEGFGLAGWEAIAAGVPLIVSEKSGLYQLLREHRNGAWLNWVFAVDIRGKVDEPYFHNEDLRVVSDKLLEIAKNPIRAREKAASLREGAFSDFPWPNCVNTALAGLQWSIPAYQSDINAYQSDIKLTRITPPLEPPVLTGQENESPSLLELPRPRWKVGSGLADSQLLRAEEAAVPFDSVREPEVSELSTWAHDPEYPQALRLITGAGGTGKTRLAIELCIRLNEDGWHCGFMPSEVGAAQATGAWAELLQLGLPLVVVFDYAETRQDTLVAFIKAMLQTEAKPRVRLLLLARDGGEWWERLSTRDVVCESFLSGYAASGPFELRPLHNSITRRETAYEAAILAYAARLGVAELPQIGVDLSGEHFDRPLYIQMAALLALHGERPASAEGLTKALLNHEQRYWTRLIHDSSLLGGNVGVNEIHAAEIVTVATLMGGLTRSADAQRVWDDWTDAGGSALQAAYKRALFERLSGLYPGQRGLQPLRPDLLGEALVAHALLQQSGPSLLDTILRSERRSSERRSALTIIARLSKYRADLQGVVQQGLIRNFASCAADLVIVAGQSDSHLPEWAENAFIQLPLPIRYQVTGMLVPLLHHDSIQLGQFTCAVAQSDLEKSKAKLMKKPADVQSRAHYARVAKQYAVALARTGLTPSAQQYAKESVEIYEEVALKTTRFEYDHAGALTCYSNRLSENGHHDNALMYSQQALTLYERLAVHDSRVEPELARALCNHAISMSRSGEGVQPLAYALRGLKYFEKLANRNPDQFDPDKAWALSTYAGRLTQVGRYEEALLYSEESLRLYEKLAVKNADRFEPEVASALSNYSIHLIDLGEFVQALDYEKRSLIITKRICARRPLVHAEDLYIRSLSVQWMEWFNNPGFAPSEPIVPVPGRDLSKPHRVPVLQVFHAWLQACYQDEHQHRTKNLSEIVRIATGLTLAQFAEIEQFWFCASAWLNRHALSQGEQHSPPNWEALWREFVEQRQGHIPLWMDTVAERFGFGWPKGGAQP